MEKDFNLFHYGNIIYVKDYSTPSGVYTVRIIENDGYLFLHEMCNGEEIPPKCIGRSFEGPSS